MELTNLKRIGLTEGEIKLYSALLDLGETTRTQLAKKSGVSPSKIYDVANGLLKKGIISAVKKNNILHFSAGNPERIKDFVQRKEAELSKEKALVEQMLPTLVAKYQTTEEQVDVDVFYGWEGMKTVFDDIIKTLNKNEADYVFGASQGLNSKQADIFFTKYYQKKKKKGFATKIIFNEEVRKNKQRTSLFLEKPNEMRFLHTQTFAEINVYHNKALIILLLKNPIIIRLKSDEASDTFMKFFHTLWALAKP